MADVRQIIGGRPNGQAAQQIVQGVVSSQQPAPGNFNAALCVVIPPGVTVMFDSWPAVHGETLPTAGTTVRIGIDDRREWFVLSWDGQHS